MSCICIAMPQRFCVCFRGEKTIPMNQFPEMCLLWYIWPAFIKFNCERTILSLLFPLAQFEAVDCSPTKENTSTLGRQQQQQQQTLRPKNWNQKTLVIPSSSSSLSFPSSPILKLSPLTPSSPSFPTLKLSPLSPSACPNKHSPPSPSSPGSPLDGEAAKVDPSISLEKQR